ncbi:MAG TPA: hypothetical protein VFV50_16245, partial [Bdellovibrionales bacterium]|nr:hypothetical protein [Bdellovibrionales bacterium]
IYIDKSQLEQMEYLLAQSAQGFHLLFESGDVKRILSLPTESMDFFTFENLNRIQQILGDFLKKKSFMEKKLFLEKLDTESYELLVRSYFNIVDNAVMESTKLRH